MITPISDEIIAFFSRYPLIRYHRGEKLLHANEYFDQMYLIKGGMVKIYKVLSSGQEIIFSNHNPKKQKFMILGYSSLLRNYYVEAICDIEVYRCPVNDFKKYADKNPSVKDYLITIYRDNIEELITQIEWLSIPDAYTRIKAVLYSLGRRIGVVEDGKLVLMNKSASDIKLSHQLIASMTGLSRESVTIQINRLIAEGVLDRKNNSLVLVNLTNPLDEIA